MRVVVTGGSGFIGRRLVEELVHQGNQVQVPVLQKRDPIHTDVKYRQIDLKNKSDCQTLLQDTDAIFHLATVLEKGVSQSEILNSNILMMENLLNASQQNNVTHFFLASTLLINTFLKNPKQETTRPGYIQSKMTQERLLTQAIQETGLRGHIGRIGNCYGPGFTVSGQPSVIGAFVSRAVTHEPLVVFGSGKQKRSFVFVDDAVKGVLKISQAKAPTEALDITFPQIVSINELANEILEKTGSKSLVSHRPEDHEDVSEPEFDTEKTARLTGFKATTNLDQGLEKTIEWYRNTQKKAK